jgi:hypothetical protein
MAEKGKQAQAQGEAIEEDNAEMTDLAKQLLGVMARQKKTTKDLKKIVTDMLGGLCTRAGLGCETDPPRMREGASDPTLSHPLALGWAGLRNGPPKDARGRE